MRERTSSVPSEPFHFRPDSFPAVAFTLACHRLPLVEQDSCGYNTARPVSQRPASPSSEERIGKGIQTQKNTFDTQRDASTHSVNKGYSVSWEALR